MTRAAWIFGAIIAMSLGLSWMGFVPTFLGALIAMSVAAIALFYLPAGVFQKIGYIVGTILLAIFVLLPVVGASLTYMASGSRMTAETLQENRAAWHTRIATRFWPSGRAAEDTKQGTCREIEKIRTEALEPEYDRALAAVRANPWDASANQALEEANRKKAWIVEERERCKKPQKLHAGYAPPPGGASGSSSGGSSSSYSTRTATVVRGSTDWSIIDEISPEMVGIMVLAGIGLILVTRKASGFGILVGLALGVSLGLMLILQYYPRYGVTEEVMASALTAAAILAVAGWFGGARTMTVALIFAFLISLIPAFSHYSDWCERYNANCPLVLHADGRRY